MVLTLRGKQMLSIYVDTFRLLWKIYKAVPWQSGQYVRRESAECLRILKPRGKLVIFVICKPASLKAKLNFLKMEYWT